MELLKFLTDAARSEGASGHEGPERERLTPYFEAVSEDVRRDALGNLIGRIGQGGPRVMICAHMDEIAMVVRLIEEDGSLRLRSVGGVDARILPAGEVIVRAKDGDLYGVVGAKPPHLLTAEEAGRARDMNDMFVDVGLPAQEVKKRVRVGDVVTLTGDVTPLCDGQVSGKTMDDRCGIAAMLLAAEELNRRKVHAETYLAASVQEETGKHGAITATCALDPDAAVIIDVCHAVGAGAVPPRAMPIDRVGLQTGPVIHPQLLKIAKETAKAHHIDIQVRASGEMTHTDADAVQIMRMGVPCLLIEIPLRYMHTSVETISTDTVREAGRLIALFVDELSRRWEEIIWN